MGSEGKSRKKKRSPSISEDEGSKSRKRRTGDDRERERKSSRSDKKEKKKSKKSHKRSTDHADKGMKSSGKHDRKHSKKSGLPSVEELTNDDYFSKNNEFSTWLKEEKGLFFSDLSSETARGLFSDFVKEWNSKTLESRYYEGIASGPRTAHNWKMKK